MGHGWTINDGTFDYYPLDKRRKRDVPCPRFVVQTHRAMNSLSSLQLSRDAPISMCAMDMATSFLWKCLPKDVRNSVYIPPPNGPALWGTSEEAAQAMHQTMDQQRSLFVENPVTNEAQYRFYVDIKKRPWIIWPIWVEDEWGYDWVTVVWHSRRFEEAKAGPSGQLVAYAIIDPRRKPTPDASGKHEPVQSRLDRIRTRLHDIWRRAGYDTQQVEELKLLSNPTPTTETSSGERCYAAVKELGEQLVRWHVNGRVFCPKTTLANLSPWVSPFQMRIEMTGISAWSLMATFDYNARISVEAIQPNTRTEVVANGEKKYLYNYDLAGNPDEALIASPDYLISANH
ncbi:hypothetical protein GGS20DRAFT_579588 [Poronia punctata]|nr:hypothetical protein GGS20DRAFT_579588 [Poronia punctata]